MAKKRDDREIIILEQESSGLKWLVLGAAVGAGLALLLAPASGEETRRQLARRARRIQRAAVDAVDELKGRFDAFRGAGEAGEEEDEDEEPALAEEELGLEVEERGETGSIGPRETSSSARAELERRLAAARARRREPALEDEEPVA